MFKSVSESSMIEQVTIPVLIKQCMEFIDIGEKHTVTSLHVYPMSVMELHVYVIEQCKINLDTSLFSLHIRSM